MQKLKQNKVHLVLTFTIENIFSLKFCLLLKLLELKRIENYFIFTLCYETLQVYSHNVMEKSIKFQAIAGIFWNFSSGLKL